jgi:DMSO/TMAO reductase YedYZ molybdopterin-dependent catalytic subunit
MAHQETEHRSSTTTAARRAPLPPGQHRVDGFPRFGTHLQKPAPPVPAQPEIRVEGAGMQPLRVPLADLQQLPRREMTADFHCVAGWTATDLQWEGVPFTDFYRLLIQPAVPEGTVVTHVAFRGLDRYRAVASIEDALAPSVLLAQNLNGEPLNSDHGAPVRLVSPDQYGFVSTKHLCRIELHPFEPVNLYHPRKSVQRALRTVRPHRRARVWSEERHRYVPAWLIRRIYRRLVPLPAPAMGESDQSGASVGAR